jgi:hypothetical protein
MGDAINERNPLILSYLQCQLETVARGIVCKVPVSKKRDVLHWLSDQGYRCTEVLLQAHDSDDFELCEWGACFLKTDKRIEMISALAKKLSSQQT